MIATGNTKAALAQHQILNFVVAGDSRAGTSVVQSALDHTPRVTCHGDLFFDSYGTQQEQQALRREAHESYFGTAPPAAAPEWLTETGNPCRYLCDQVWDHPHGDENRVGVRLLYQQLARYDLYDLLEERYQEGDFCVVHVLRNPVVCRASLSQACQSGRWLEHTSEPVQDRLPTPVSLDVPELVAFVRRHEAIRRKIKFSCRDLLEVPYHDLCLDYQATMEGICEFLELPPQRVALPSCRRLRNRDLRGRIYNLAQLRAELPHDMRAYLDEDLF